MPVEFLSKQRGRPRLLCLDPFELEVHRPFVPEELELPGVLGLPGHAASRLPARPVKYVPLFDREMCILTEVFCQICQAMGRGESSCQNGAST